MADDEKKTISSSVIRHPSSIFLCPRCHKGKLYKGLLAIADRCGACGLSYGGHEQGDGPAFLAILIIGALTAIGAAITEIKYEPPYWLHAVIWIPFVVLGSVFSLRFLKAALVQAQYQVKREDFEDKYFSELSDKRLAEGGKNISHEEAWKEKL